VRNALAAAENFRAEHVVDDMKRTINHFLNESPTGRA
jgi:hypothetical protein